MIKNITVILVSPENIDNMGAVARAIKNMGFCNLRLIKPPSNWRIKGRKMAVSGADILERAKVFSSLERATEDLNFVVGTTRRRGEKRGSFISFEEAVKKIKRKTKRFKTGIVFGRESKGLSNNDLELCDALTTIPANAIYPSLNLAQAVMVCLFAINLRKTEKEGDDKENFLNKKEIKSATNRFRGALKKLGYGTEKDNVLERIMTTLDGMIKRNGLLESESQMIKGLSRRISEKVSDSKNK